MISLLCGTLRNSQTHKQNSKVVVRGWELGNKLRLVKWYKLSAIKWIRFDDIMETMVTKLMTPITLYNWNWLRVELKYSQQIYKKEGCVN